MTKRIFSTLVLWSLVTGILLVGEADGGFVLLIVLSCLAQFEFYQLADRVTIRPSLRFAGIAFGVAFLCLVYFESWPMAGGLLLLAILSVADGLRCGWSFLQFPTTKGMLYIPCLLAFFPMILNETGTLAMVVWVVAVVKCNDAGALLGGVWFGRHKLWPSLSPGKTVEGAVSGIVIGCLVGVLLLISGLIAPEVLKPQEGALLALVLGPVGIASDLLESWLKRRTKAKDSGNIIPGIGGVLDLIDSLLLAGPATWCLLKLLH